MRRFIGQGLLAIGLAVFVVACNSNGTTPTPITPTPTTPAVVTETYTGDLQSGGSKIHSFNVGTGVVAATLSALTPADTTAIGAAFGIWDGTTCSAITPTPVESTSMTVGTSLVGTAMQPVSLCLKAFDVGTIPAGSTYSYTLTVEHY